MNPKLNRDPKTYTDASCPAQQCADSGSWYFPWDPMSTSSSPGESPRMAWSLYRAVRIHEKGSQGSWLEPQGSGFVLGPDSTAVQASQRLTFLFSTTNTSCTLCHFCHLGWCQSSSSPLVLPEKDLQMVYGQAHSPRPPDAWLSAEDSTVLPLSGGPGV